MRVLRFIVHNWPLKIGAIALAVSLYTAMVVLQSTAVWPGSVAIEVVNQPSNSYLVGPSPMRAVTSIRYVAAPNVPVSQASFRARIDLASVKTSESDSSSVRVELFADDPRIQIVDYQPQQISIQLDPVIHSTVPVQVFTEAPPSGLQTGAENLSFSTVDVYGAARYVHRVAYAQAPVRIDSSGLDVDQDVDLVARDASNNPVDNVVFNPRQVHVQILVGSQIRTETVPVDPTSSITGAPAAGYYITSIDVKPAVVSVQGQADALALLKGKASTKPISIAGATGDVTVSVGLDLPAGVTADATTKIAVTIHLQSPASTRSVSVGVVPVGARPDRIYTLSTPSVIVTLGGAAASLNAFDTSTLVGAVSVGDLDSGTYNLKISVVLPAGISLVGITPSQITVTITNVATPTPPPPPQSASPTP